MDFVIQIANRNILIQGASIFLQKECKNYLADEGAEPEIRIGINEAMVLAEKEFQQKNGETFSRTASESILIHRLVTEALLDRGVFLMHGAVIAADHESYLFSAQSGTGKTTHVQKWLQNIKDSYIVNGDKPMIIVQSDGAFACGTPWCGKEHFGTNAVVPLRSIVFMQRDEINRMEKIPFKVAFPLLFEQIYHPLDAYKMKKTLALLTGLRECVTFYKFYCNNFRDDAFQVSHDTLTRRN